VPLMRLPFRLLTRFPCAVSRLRRSRRWARYGTSTDYTRRWLSHTAPARPPSSSGRTNSALVPGAVH